MSTAGIYSPWHYQSEDLRDAARSYFGDWDDDRIISAIYGGERLDREFDLLELAVDDERERIVTIKLRRADGSSFEDDIVLSQISLRQLLVESSGSGADADDEEAWSRETLGPQRRLEICQNELSRWSVVFARDANWSGADVRAPGSVTEVELINNCTTAEGFELKVRTGEGDARRTFHGSVTLPQREYKRLSRLQAGAWARQGWNGEADHRLFFDGELGERPVPELQFADLYYGEEHGDRRVAIGLERYRKLAEDRPEHEASVWQDRGVIDYRRWGGEGSEYYAKPHLRRLVAATDANHWQTPPTTYDEILTRRGAGAFRLTNFHPNGLYQVADPTSKTHYPQLAGLTVARIWRTAAGLQELVIENPHASGMALRRVVIGNLRFDELDLEDGLRVIDRFGFNPRKTVRPYDPNWRPAFETDGGVERAPYAWLLAAEGWTRNSGVFLQPESFGIERVILSYADERREALVVDLISFERMLPVWRGLIPLSRSCT